MKFGMIGLTLCAAMLTVGCSKEPDATTGKQSEAPEMKETKATEPKLSKEERRRQVRLQKMKPLIEKADQGDVVAQCKVADMYLKMYFEMDNRGRSRTDYKEQALKYYTLAAGNKCPEALYALADIYDDDYYPESRQKARYYYRKIFTEALKGSAEWVYYCGKMFEEGKGDNAKDMSKAFGFYTIAANQGFSKAQLALAKFYKDGLAVAGLSADKEEALKCIKLAADQGEAEAQLKLAYCYREEKDLKQAKYYAQLAADQGFLGAEYLLFAMEAERGDAEAQYECGKRDAIYSMSYGPEPEYLKRAAAQGHAKAKALLKKIATAKECNALREMAEKGDANAQYELGMRYRHADGVRLDFQQAMDYLVKAANEGHLKAKVAVAMMYDGSDPYFSLDLRKMGQFAESAAEQGEYEPGYKLACLMLESNSKVERRNGWHKEYGEDACEILIKLARMGHKASQEKLRTMNIDWEENLDEWRRQEERE